MNQKLLESSAYFSNVPVMAMSFLLPLYSMELGFTAIETTGLFAVVSMSLLLSKIMAGNICDKIGRKKVFCFGLFLNALAYVALAFSQNAVSLYLAQALKGGAISLVSVSMHTIMSDNINESFAVRQSKISNARGRGELIGVLICWALLSTVTFTESWKYLLLIGSGLTCYSAFVSQKGMIETKMCSPSSSSIPIPEKLTGLFFVQILLSLASSLTNVFAFLNYPVLQKRLPACPMTGNPKNPILLICGRFPISEITNH